MKARIYDNLFDNSAKYFIYFLSFLATYVCWFGLFSAVAGIFFTMSWSTYWVYISAFMSATVTGVILLAKLIAKKRYEKEDSGDEIKWRDIWMAWATEICYVIDDDIAKECDDWIEENINGLHRIIIEDTSVQPYNKFNSIFIFKQQTDAVAFKLVWEGKINGSG